MSGKCEICMCHQGKGQTYGDKWVCDDCVAWAEGNLSRKTPGGWPPKSGLAFFTEKRLT